MHTAGLPFTVRFWRTLVMVAPLCVVGTFGGQAIIWYTPGPFFVGFAVVTCFVTALGLGSWLWFRRLGWLNNA